ncbi:DUF6968 family protein [Polyangium jinanense]|uniref:DUF6968 domain-containing protein n=1 Tax=Polyangium jinanense TaxID=2829994 RepID=A0A9X3X7J8_9BACT|nr:hypothetical protein [Polyangium jinanense]MDC3954358.1 hypothetical protein [Polyangium jinanense]MDC3984190.1 hypothetical protein [Polyangium jinanense]
MQIMAERKLTFVENGTGRRRVVRVRIGLPRRDERGPDWVVEYEIIGPGRDRVIRRRVLGIDAIQVLVTALNVIIPAQLENLADFVGGRLLFMKSDDLGFVVHTSTERKP